MARSSYGGGGARIGASPAARGAAGSTSQSSAGSATVRRLRSFVATPRGLRQALLAKEVLDQPVALRPPGERPPRSP